MIRILALVLGIHLLLVIFLKLVIDISKVTVDLLFKLLFDAASQTILNHARMKNYLGGDCGITMVLHTWGQDMSFHPHVHCIVTGGGFDGNHWIEAEMHQKKGILKIVKNKSSSY